MWPVKSLTVAHRIIPRREKLRYWYLQAWKYNIFTSKTVISVITSSRFYVAVRHLCPGIDHLVVNDNWAHYHRIYFIYKITN
jgi:hypothetical protein